MSTRVQPQRCRREPAAGGLWCEVEGRRCLCSEDDQSHATGSRAAKWADCPKWEQEFRNYIADKYGQMPDALDEALDDGHAAVEFYKEYGDD